MHAQEADRDLAATVVGRAGRRGAAGGQTPGTLTLASAVTRFTRRIRPLPCAKRGAAGSCQRLGKRG